MTAFPCLKILQFGGNPFGVEYKIYVFLAQMRKSGSTIDVHLLDIFTPGIFVTYVWALSIHGSMRGIEKELLNNIIQWEAYL